MNKNKTSKANDNQQMIFRLIRFFSEKNNKHITVLMHCGTDALAKTIGFVKDNLSPKQLVDCHSNLTQFITDNSELVHWSNNRDTMKYIRSKAMSHHDLMMVSINHLSYRRHMLMDSGSISYEDLTKKFMFPIDGITMDDITPIATNDSCFISYQDGDITMTNEYIELTKVFV